MKYAPEYIEWALGIENANQCVIINPRNIYASSLHELDEDWMRDKHTFSETVKFLKDYGKRDSNMK